MVDFLSIKYDELGKSLIEDAHIVEHENDCSFEQALGYSVCAFLLHFMEMFERLNKNEQ